MMKLNRWTYVPRQQHQRLSGSVAVRSSRWASQVQRSQAMATNSDKQGLKPAQVRDQHCSRWDSSKRCHKVAAAAKLSANVRNRWGALMVTVSGDAKPKQNPKRKATCDEVGVGPADESTREHTRRHCKQDAYKTCARCRHRP